MLVQQDRFGAMRTAASPQALQLLPSCSLFAGHFVSKQLRVELNILVGLRRTARIRLPACIPRMELRSC